jgi:hypothetical protein
MVLSTLMVNNLNDSANFTVGDGSLRGEIAAAQSGDTIQFSSNLAGGTINLTAGELLINNNLSIIGLTCAGAPDITINAGGASRVFDIEGGSNGINVTLQNLTITGGAASEGAGLLINDPAGTIALNNLDITSNQAAGAAGVNGPNPGTNTPAQAGGAGQVGLGGGVYFAGGNAAALVISNSLLQSNVASGGNGGQGGFGGLYLGSSSVQISGGVIEGNTAQGGTGGSGGPGGHVEPSAPAAYMSSGFRWLCLWRRSIRHRRQLASLDRHHSEQRCYRRLQPDEQRLFSTASLRR